MSISLKDFPNEIKASFFHNLPSIEDIDNFGLADRSFDTLSKINYIWLNFAHKIGCPIPDPGLKDFKDYEVRNLTKAFIESLRDHIEYYENLQLESLSIENINSVQRKIEILDIFSIWKKIITFLPVSRRPAHQIPFDSSKFSDYNYLTSQFSNWVEKNQTDLSSLVNLSFYNINLRTLPNAFCKLKHIRQLDLSYNHIIDLSDELSSLKNLEELNLKYNELRFVPKCLFDLPRLKKLFLEENPLYNANESLKKLKEKDIEVDLTINIENQKKTDKVNTKETVILITARIVLILGILFLLILEQLNEKQ